jgi:hypothetical protein
MWFADKRQAKETLARFPGPVTLYPSRLQTLAGVVIFVGLTIFSAWRLPGILAEWTSEVIWAVGALVVCATLAVRGAILLMPGAHSFTLDAQGFETCRVFRRIHRLWRNVGGFRVHQPDDERIPNSIVYDAQDGETETLAALAGNYRFSDEDFARLLNAWRERAITLPRPASVPRVGPVR